MFLMKEAEAQHSPSPAVAYWVFRRCTILFVRGLIRRSVLLRQRHTAYFLTLNLREGQLETDNLDIVRFKLGPSFANCAAPVD